MKSRLLLFLAFVSLSASVAVSQTYLLDMQRQSARSDSLTRGIQKASFVAGDGRIRITINIPSFQMTLWQDEKEIRSYPIGIGVIEYPLPVGIRQATSIEWNPVWIPPSSDWIEASSTVKVGEVILPTDPRNPLGKLKISMGYGYLLHQAKSASDLGSLVSHGCVRVMQSDLYDLAEKIVAARRLSVPAEQIASAKRTKKTLTVAVEPPVPVELTYDTIVVEDGVLHIYPDVYLNKTNSIANLRAELAAAGAGDELSDAELAKMLAAAKGRKQFVVKISDLKAGWGLAAGKVVPVVTPSVAATQKRRRVN